jgi:wobble nucleotide-excising tRNase
VEQAKLQAKCEDATNHLRAVEDELEKARNQKPDQALAQAVTDAQGKLDGARTAADAARQQLEASEPEAVALRVEAARSALGSIEADINKLQQAARDLRVELRALGQKGLGEDKDRLEGELAAARAMQAGVNREAQAIRLLHRVLSEAEKTAKETFLSPVTRHLRPYLKLLLPDAELRMNEDIEIVGLQRGAVIEEFEHLSVGTREQLAVLTRLAFADLLREKGQPAAVILDDAIAYADRDRFERMQLILRKASKNLQVIVLTCRERDYQGLGAPIVRLDQCRVRSAAPSA